MPITSSSWSYAIDPGVSDAFLIAANRPIGLLEMMYNTGPSAQATEEIFGVGAVGIDAWEEYENSGIVPEADFNQGFKTTFAHREYPLIIPIMRKLYDDNQFPNILNIARNMGDSAAQKRETDAASTFNNAFTAGASAGADGVALCSASHPQSPHDTGTVQSNFSALPLTDENVSLVRQEMRAFKDDKNGLLGINPNRILVPPELEDTAIKQLRSTQDPNSAENAINPQAGRFDIVTWDFLTDSNAWFMLDTNKQAQSLLWFNREMLSISPMVEDKTIRARWIAYMRYSFGFIDWRWIYGCNPS